MSLFPRDDTIPQNEYFILDNQVWFRTDSMILENHFQWNSGIDTINLYCESVECLDNCRDYVIPEKIKVVNIFARDFLSKTNQSASLRRLFLFPTEAQPVRELCIYYQNAPGDVEVVCGEVKGVYIAYNHEKAECQEKRGFDDGWHEHFDEDWPPPSLLQSEPLSLSDAKESGADLTKIAIAGLKHDAGPSRPSIKKAIGRRFVARRGSPLTYELLYEVPATEFAGPSPLEVADKGPSANRQQCLKNLLLTIFSRVTGDILRNKNSIEESISALKFVVRFSRSSSAVADLTADAQKLLDRLEIPARAPGLQEPGATTYYVPHLNFAELAKYAKVDLDRAQAAHAQITRIDSELVSVDQFNKGFKAIMTSVHESMKGFTNSDDSRELAKRAIYDCEAKRREMQDYAGATHEATEKFCRGADAWIREKKEDFESNLVKLAAELTAAMGITVFTFGAASGNVAAKLIEIKDAIKEGVKVHLKEYKIQAALQKILPICEKLLPKLDDARRNVYIFMEKIMALDEALATDPSLVKKMAGEVLSELASKITNDQLPFGLVAHVDYLGILANWDELDIEVEGMFKGFQAIFDGEDVDGLAGYYVALKKQAARGRLVVSALRNVQEAMQLFWRQRAEEIVRSSRMVKVADLTNQQLAGESQQRNKQEVLRWSLVQELASAKRHLFVRFHQLLLSLIYYGNRPEIATALLEAHPIQSTSGLAAYDKLLAATNAKYESIGKLEQNLPVVISWSKNKKCFDPLWPDFLTTDKVLQFAIPPGAINMLKGYERVRITEMVAEFTGMPAIADPDGDPLIWQWELGPNLADLNSDGEKTLYYMPPLTLTQRNKEGQWELASSKYRFTLPSLYSQGRLTFADASGTGKSSLDLSGVTDVKLSFKCVLGTR